MHAKNRTVDILSLIPTTTVLLMVVITIAAFALSYSALVNLAIRSGIPPLLSWLWPLCFDAFMVVASLDVVRREVAGEPVWTSWALVVAVTGASVLFNIIDAPNNLISQMVYATPPLVVFAAFEKVMGVVRSQIWNGPVREEAVMVPDSVPSLPVRDDQERDEGDPMHLIKQFLQNHPGSGLTDIARGIGMPKTSASRRLNQMIVSGIVIRSGTGYLLL